MDSTREELPIKAVEPVDRKQCARSRLLKLPVELIHIIADQVPLVDRGIFALTCRSLRATIARPSVHEFTACQCLDYLSRIARDLPDEWGDTPATPWRFTCPSPWDQWCKKVYNQPSRLDSRLIQIDHRHIQLALKYTRLKYHSYQLYLRELLKEHRDTAFPTHPPPHGQPNILDVEYVATPNIVKDSDGNFRYLLKSTWDYRKAAMEISLVTVGDLKLCPHFHVLGHLRDTSTGLLKAIQTVWKEIINSKKNRYKLFCRRCATDTTITILPEHISVCIYQDFGIKGSPGHINWEKNLANPRLNHPAAERRPMFKNYGSIRKLYDQNQTFQFSRQLKGPTVPVTGSDDG
ncbi:hypothetical protein F5Y11DRAFT_367189 [Daldinia sp. FL1419]|nr:hypothetical protein F5Y11DRAFT_367189 [Daldinia sp. FL1419]